MGNSSAQGPNLQLRSRGESLGFWAEGRIKGCDANEWTGRELGRNCNHQYDSLRSVRSGKVPGAFSGLMYWILEATRRT